MQVYILANDYTKLIKVHIIINLIHFSKKCDLVLKWQKKLKFEKSSVFQKPQLLNQVGHMIGFGMVSCIGISLPCVYKDRHVTKIFSELQMYSLCTTYTNVLNVIERNFKGFGG